MYYTLPIEIDRRRLHCCKLVNSNENERKDKGEGLPIKSEKTSNTTAEYAFVIGRKTHQHTLLFQIEAGRGSPALLCSEGYELDGEIDGNYELKSSFKEEGTGCLDLTIEFNTTESKVKDIRDNQIGLRMYRETGSKVVFKAEIADNDRLNNCEISLEIIYHYQQERYSDKLLFYCVDQSLCYDIALDFGSESSQAAYKRMDTQSMYGIPLLEEFKKFYGDKKSDKGIAYKDIEKDKFHQYEDAPSISLIKSLFFVNKAKLPTNYARWENHLTEKPSADHPVELLLPNTDEYEEKNRLMLPNLKLIELGNEKWFLEKFEAYNLHDSYMQDILKRCVLNHFFHACFQHVQTQKKGIYTEEKKMAVRICLLIPNVYNQEQVYRLIQNAYTDIEKFKTDYQIGQVEVSVMSESDAAFAGYIANLRATGGDLPIADKSAKYLVLDAGKGTLDISIVEMLKDASHEFRTLYRAGIPGSGQYLSFAFFEVIAYNFMNRFKSDVAEKILSLLEICKKLPADNIKSFWKELNELKHLGLVDIGERNPKEYSPSKLVEEKYNKDRFVDFIEHITQEVSQLNQQRDKMLPDIHQSIPSYLKKIGEEVEKLIQTSGIGEKGNFHEIILTGRTFHFSPLRNAMSDLLVDKMELVEGKHKVIFNGENAKSISLHGALADACKLNFASDVIGALLLKRPAKNNIWLQVKQLFGAQKIPVNTKGQEIHLFKLDKNFYLGINDHNYYTPQADDEFYIGNMNYLRGHENDGILTEDIDETQFRINIEQKGYVLRYPKGRSSIEFRYNKRFAERNDFIIKSIYPFAATEEMIRLYKSDSQTERRKQAEEELLSKNNKRKQANLHDTAEGLANSGMTLSKFFSQKSFIERLKTDETEEKEPVTYKPENVPNDNGTDKVENETRLEPKEVVTIVEKTQKEPIRFVKELESKLENRSGTIQVEVDEEY